MPFDPPPVTSSDTSSEKVILINHPLVQHKLTIMRQVETHTQDFRRLLKEIAMLLAYEVTRDLPLKKQTIKTPLAEMEAPMLAAEQKNGDCFDFAGGAGFAGWHDRADSHRESGPYRPLP